MIEMRIIDNGLMCRPDFQYRYKNQLPPGCISDQFWKEWSEWITVEQVKEEESKEEPKTLDLDEIQQEFDEKIDELIENTKNKFYQSKYLSEKLYSIKFDRIIENFEYAKEHGQFPYLKLAYTTTGLSAYTSPYTETPFVIKQGNKHEGYYTIGNQRYLKYYMPDKPNFISRFFMDKLLGFFWVDEKDG